MGRGADFLYQEGLHDYQLKLELKFRVYCILLYTKAEGIKDRIEYEITFHKRYINNIILLNIYG